MHTKEEIEGTIVALHIEHINSIGAIIDNSLMLPGHSRKLIEIRDIKRVEVFKTRNFKYNAFFISCIFPIIYILNVYKFTTLELLLISGFMICLLGLGLFINKLEYILAVRTLDMSSIEIKVNKYSKDDAKRIAHIINKRIKKTRK